MLWCIERPRYSLMIRRIHRVRQFLAIDFAELADRTIAGLLLAAASPFLLISAALGARFITTVRIGAGGRTFRDRQLVWKNNRPVRGLASVPRLWNILLGRLSFVGPRVRRPEEVNLRNESDRQRLSLSPGIVCHWWVRQRTTVDYGTEAETDMEYVNSRSFRTNVGIACRAAVAFCFGSKTAAPGATATILGMPIDNLTLDEAVDRIVKPRGRKPLQVSFINVDCFNKAALDPEYREILQSSGLRLGDGIGLRIAGRILKCQLRQNVNGTDLFPRLCARMETERLRIFLLGGRPGVAEDVATWIKSRYPRLQLAGLQNGYFEAADEPAIVEAINESDADILLAAFGAPAQEKFIRRNQDRLKVAAALGVGGLFDFYSGRIPRAPQWMRDIGMEWIYRLYQEPGRMWKRYLVGNAAFLARIIWSRTAGQSSHKPQSYPGAFSA